MPRALALSRHDGAVVVDPPRPAPGAEEDPRSLAHSGTGVSPSRSFSSSTQPPPNAATSVKVWNSPPWFTAVNVPPAATVCRLDDSATLLRARAKGKSAPRTRATGGTTCACGGSRSCSPCSCRPSRSGGGGGLQAVKQRYLPAAQAHLREHARRCAGAVRRRARPRRGGRGGRPGREGRAGAPRRPARAAAARRSPVPRRSIATDGFRSLGPLAALPPVTAPVGPRRPDATLARRLAAAAESANGAVGIWVHDLATGRYAGYEAETRFAAASTVKLGALVAGLRASPQVERSRWWYDVRQIGFWSSNLAANRILAKLGYGAVADGLRRLGMTSSTYPGPYRATTAYRPPGPHTRVTTARDLGRALHRLHAGAHGDQRVLGLLGLTRPPGRRRAAGPRLRAAGRRQRRAAAALARRRGRRREERLALRHAHDRRDRPRGGPRDDRRRRALPARASPTPRRSGWDAACCSQRVCCDDPGGLRRQPVERLLQLAVERARLGRACRRSRSARSGRPRRAR